MRKTLFYDKYIGYHTFGLQLDNVTVAQTEENQGGQNPSPSTPDPNNPGRTPKG